jgi:hypothetical protein
VWLGESLSPLTWLGGALIVAASVMAVWPAARQTAAAGRALGPGATGDSLTAMMVLFAFVLGAGLFCPAAV